MKQIKILGILILVLLAGFGFINLNVDSASGKIIGEGKQPDIFVDAQGVVKLTYGAGNTIYYTFSKDGGKTFASLVEVATLPKLGLGMGRAPQIISTADYTTIAATNNAGNIYSWRLVHKTQKWENQLQVNDADTIAKEGFVGLAAGSKNNVFAVWLDLRGDKQNKIYGTRSEDGGKAWQKNQLVYRSPDKTVCECCKPAITADNKGKVHIQFRNWLNGARDLHVISSADNGKSFGKAQKLGLGTWNLKGCPMDGGDITTDGKGNIFTVWRREQSIYLAQPGKPEEKVGEGKTPTLVVTNNGPAVAWQQNGSILYRNPAGKIQEIAKGAYPKLALMPGNKVIGTWEQDGKIVVQGI